MINATFLKKTACFLCIIVAKLFEMIVPYKEKRTGKKEQVAEMFNNISHRYDFLNHFLSLGIDILWRKKAIRMLKADQPKQIPLTSASCRKFVERITNTSKTWPTSAPWPLAACGAWTCSAKLGWCTAT